MVVDAPSAPSTADTTASGTADGSTGGAPTPLALGSLPPSPRARCVCVPTPPGPLIVGRVAAHRSFVVDSHRPFTRPGPGPGPGADLAADADSDAISLLGHIAADGGNGDNDDPPGASASVAARGRGGTTQKARAMLEMGSERVNAVDALLAEVRWGTSLPHPTSHFGQIHLLTQFLSLGLTSHQPSMYSDSVRV